MTFLSDLLPGRVLAARACGLIALAPAARAADPATETLPAAWQTHEYRFTFTGFTSDYSCNGLAGDLKTLLLAAGARADVKVVPVGCGPAATSKLASAYLTFATLAPAAGSTTAAASGDTQAIWRKVEFASHSPTGSGPRNLSIGSCELVQQFRRDLLPMFTTRSVDDKSTCVPHQLSGSGMNLRFESLALLPTKKDAGATSAGK